MSDPSLFVPKETPPLADADARAAIETDLQTTLFVEAAAGTGKTTALVNRLVALLASGTATLERMVALTFTDKAAGEMKLRLRSEIERHRASPRCTEQERARFEAALEQLEIARIGTIHAFCADLLRERPVEAGVDPLFQVAPDDVTKGLLDEAFDDWFQRALEDPPEGMRRVLHRRIEDRNQESARDSLRMAAERLIEHRDFPAAWHRPPFDRNGRIDEVLEVLAEVAAYAVRARRSDDWLAKNLRNIQQFLDDNATRERSRPRDYDGLEVELRTLLRRRDRRKAGWEWKGSGRMFGEDVERDDLIQRRDAARQRLEELVEEADADLAACLRHELREVVDAFERLKAAAGCLDFLDLMLRARDLIKIDATVRGELQERFSHFFVDEFQDTDPLQVELLLLLAADDADQTDASRIQPIPGKLFLVGDPKQSIYRFRRADIGLYERTKTRLVESGARVLHLTTSFRSVPALQAAINGAFDRVMRLDLEVGQAAFVPQEPFRSDHTTQPAVVTLPVPRPYSPWGKITKWSIDESMPDAVGAFVQWLLEHSGWKVTDRNMPGAMVPVSARHICILFRRFKSFRTDVTRGYVRALEARRIPHVLVGGRSFHDREEVVALRSVLSAIEWPDDSLAVYATLRGPFLAFHDETLLAYRHRVGKLHPLQPLDGKTIRGLDSDLQEVAEALQILAQLHRSRNHRPIAHTVARLLDSVRAHGGVATWPTGEQALANCLRMVDRAHRFERNGARSFRSFVDWLEEEAERGMSDEAPVVEEGTEGVRIMTVHKAKGLEFPVVILADPTCNAAPQVPRQHVDGERGLWAEPLCGATPWDLLVNREIEGQREQAEAVRLAYVAATRARDVLVIPAVGDENGDEPNGWWLDTLRPAIYPEAANRRQPTHDQHQPAIGCPAFGEDSVLERPEEARVGSARSVMPGQHRSQVGTTATWWDPATLELGAQESLGLRQAKLLYADEHGATVRAGIEAHGLWQEQREATIKQGSRPSMSTIAATALAETRAEDSLEDPALPPVEFHQTKTDRTKRPPGPRLGTLVHAALAAVQLDAEEEAVKAIVQSQGRMIGASEPEMAAAVTAVVAALQHPLLERARVAAASGGVRRETPLVLPMSGQQLLEGVVDLAFRETRADGTSIWTVVDFKTDRDLEPKRAVYEEQVRLYVRAIEQATAEPARGCLLGV